MTILIHVLIAISSLLYAGYVYLSPTKSRIYAAYGLVALTLASGTYLVVTLHTSLLHACSTGLLYLLVAIGSLAVSQRKLASDR